LEDSPIKKSHFDTIAPVCPCCLKSGRTAQLNLGNVFKTSEKGEVDQGIITCTHPACMMEYPIIDGIPILVCDVPGYIRTNLLQILKRTDMAQEIESIIGDCTGPDSVFHSDRQHLSSYGFDHYGQFDPDEPENPAMPPGAVRAILDHVFELMPRSPGGVIIDFGCSMGRTTFELAEKYKTPVLGVDLNFGMLKCAADILKSNRFNYPRRKNGVVFENRSFPVEFSQKGQVDFWVCDVLAMPFQPDLFSFGLGLNLLDCLSDPMGFFLQTARVLKPDAQLILTSPYDWAPSATPFEGWIGGHSQRSPYQGDPEKVFRTIFSSPSPVAGRFQIVQEQKNLPWAVRLHDRSIIQYLVHMVQLKKNDPR
jgi:SAM-dependent methyltransferase/uncharacterized protein YbaR (Trm112 family)